MSQDAGTGEVEYLAHDIAPWFPVASRSMRYVMGFTDGSVADVSKLCASRTDREIIKRLGLADWYERPAQYGPRGARLQHSLDVQDGQPKFVGVTVVKPVAPHRDEPTVSQPPPDTRGVSYAPTLGSSALDELYVGYSRNLMPEKASFVRSVAVLFTEINRRHVAIEEILDELVLRGLTEGMLEDMQVQLMHKVAAAFSPPRALFWLEPPEFKRRKKGPQPKVNYPADAYAGVSAGTYTPRQWRGPARG